MSTAITALALLALGSEARCNSSSSSSRQFRGSIQTSQQPPSSGVSLVEEGSRASSESRMMAWPIAAVSEVAYGQGRYFNVQCMESHCGAQLNDCLDETDGSIEPTFNKDKREIHQSQCGIVLTCLWHEEQQEENKEKAENQQNPDKLSPVAAKALAFARSARRMQGADHCTDGISRLDESVLEGSLMKCAFDFGCQRVKTADPAEQAAEGVVPGEKKVLEEVAQGKSMVEIESSEMKPAMINLESIDANCLQSSCDYELGNCDQDIECHSMVECLEIHQSRGEDESECTKHLYQLDKVKGDVLTCGRKAKCFEASSSPSSFLELASSSASPSSFFQLAARSTSTADASVAEMRKRTDEMVKKLNTKMARLNIDMAKTVKDEKADVARLERAREESDKKMEKSEHEFEKEEQKLVEEPAPSAATSSFMESSGGPAFLEPLRKIAREARSFSMNMRQEAKQLEDFAKKKSRTLKHRHPDESSLPVSLLELGRGADLPDYAVALKAENEDDAKVQQSLAKAEKALASLKEDVQTQSADLAKEQREDAAAASAHPEASSFIQSDAAADETGWLNEFRERLHHINGVQGTPDGQLGGGSSLLETKAKSKESFDEDEMDGDLGSSSMVDEEPDVGGDTSDSVVPANDEVDSDAGGDSDAGEDVEASDASFLEAKQKSPINLDSDELRSREREVARLDDAFNSQLAKLKANNLEMQAEAKAELDKALDDQAKFEAENPNLSTDTSSLMQYGGGDRSSYNFEKHADEIRDLQSKWEREAKKLEVAADTSESDSEWQSKLDGLKEQKQEKEAKLDKIEQRMSASVAALKQDSHQISDIVKQRKKRSEEDAEPGSPSSFLETTGKHMSVAEESLHKLSAEIDDDIAKTRAEKLAILDEEKQVKGDDVTAAVKEHRSKAEIDWDNTQKATDELIAKVNAEMKTLDTDLDKTTKQDRKDLALLEQSRQSEDKSLEESEESLRELGKEELKNAVPLSNFLQKDNSTTTSKPSFFESSMNKARDVAAAIMNGAKNVGASFLQLDDKSIEANSEKAQQSINVAQEAQISKLNADLADQQRVLETEEREFAKSSSEAHHPFSFESSDSVAAPLDLGGDVGASFLQTGEAKDMLTPDVLQEWYAKFEDSLNKVRADAGLPDIPRSSFLEKGLNFASMATNEKVKKDERDVDHMQHEFDDTLSKLKHDSADITAFSREETDAAKDLQAKLDATSGTESLLQTGAGAVHFDAEKEAETLKDIERKWAADNEKIHNEYLQSTRQEDGSGPLSGWLEGEKVKAKEAEEQLRKMKDKLHQDLETLKRDTIVNNVHAGVSFLEMGAAAKDDGVMQLLSNLKSVLEKENAKTRAEAESIKEQEESLVAGHHPSSFLELGRAGRHKVVLPPAAERALSKAEADLSQLQAELSKGAV
ncbi:hypothetical protein FOZ63_025606 [Perkinsus olseni]|uniref:Uncharacterized protein n=2 Tax=Perkinsus olseni TaxID=32597 RepID=A0A7J6Q1M4_PEROL|nr:hypothetical protein FOZ63_025606 [Perkinsus olseni]